MYIPQYSSTAFLKILEKVFKVKELLWIDDEVFLKTKIMQK